MPRGAPERLLIGIRRRKPFGSPQLFIAEANILASTPRNIDVRSSFFEVRGSLRLADHVLTERSLVQRHAQTGIVTPLQRERIASLTQAGG